MRRRLAAVLLGVLAIYGGYRAWKHWSYGGFRYASCTISFYDDYGYLPARGPARFRVYIFPGLNGNWRDFIAGKPVNRWVSRLQDMGGDVVVLSTPGPPACWFRDGGKPYRDAFLANFARIKARAETAHGKRSKAIVAGISFGGLHALYAYSGQPNAFLGWEAAMPVTHVARLAEYRSLGALHGFDAFELAPALKTSRGYVAWGGKDDRVGLGLGESFYRAAKAPGIVGAPYPNLGHTTEPAVVDGLLADARRLTHPQ